MAKRKSKRRKKRPLLENKIVYAGSYARVSSTMQQDNYSIAAQLRANREFAKRKGWQIYREYTDVASGTNTDRVGFQAMMEDAEAGCFEFLVCAKLDRVSRSSLDMLEILKELEEHGISFASATEQFDFTSPIGKVLFMMLIAFAEYFIANLRAETIKGQTERAAQGFWMQRCPVGYSPKHEILANAKEGERDEIALINLFKLEKEAQTKNTFVPDATAIQDKNAAGVKLMFELASSGYASLQDIADALHDEGYRPTGRAGRLTLDRWTRDSVAKALKNLFYAGYVLYRDKYYDGNHQPIITREEFDYAQEVMRSRAKKRGKSKKFRIYLLSQLMICAKCGGAIRATYRPYITKDGHRMEYLYYRCSTPLKSGKCNLKNVAATDIEFAVERFFMKIKIPPNWQDKILDKLQSHISIDEDKETKSQLETRLKNINILFEFGELKLDEYRARRNEIQKKIGRMMPLAPINRSLDKIVAILKDFKLFWRAAKPKERQQLMQMLIDHIVLDQDDEKVYAQVHIKPSAKLLFDVALGDEQPIRLVQERERKGKKRKK